MKKVHKGSVIFNDGEYYWLIEHKNKHCKVVLECGRETIFGESLLENADIYEGEAAMKIVRERFYK